jgi:predicted Rossmann-fold nucleotide-binding protein
MLRLRWLNQLIAAQADIRARLPPHLSRKASRLAITRFFVRKTVFMKYSQAFVVLPGRLRHN